MYNMDAVMDCNMRKEDCNMLEEGSSTSFHSQHVMDFIHLITTCVALHVMK